MVRRELARLGDSAACGRILGNALDSFWNTRQIMEVRWQHRFRYSNSNKLFKACLLGISVLFIGLEAFVAYRLGQVCCLLDSSHRAYSFLQKIYSKRPWRVVQVSKEMRHMYRVRTLTLNSRDFFTEHRIYYIYSLS